MKKIKILICIAVSSLVLLGVVLVTTKCITEKNFKAVEDGPTIVLDENGEILESDDIHPLPKQMLFSTPSAQSAGITVSAIITPDNANIVKLNWNIVFQNAESEWARGKNPSDYISIEPNNTTCTISCLQEFGEPIQLSCSSRYNPTIKASCTLNYGRRISERKLAFIQQGYWYYNEEKNAYYLSFTDEIDALDFSYTSEENSTFGIGTTTLDVKEKYYLKTEKTFLELLDKYGQEISMPGASMPMTTAIPNLEMSIVDLTHLMGADPNSTKGENFLYYDLLPDYIYNNPDATLFWIVLEISYNGAIINTFEYPIRAAKWDFGTAVQELTLNQNSICF